MGIFDFLENVPVIGDVINVAQKGTDLIQDWLGTDYKRSEDVSSNLQEQQFEYNSQMLNSQQGFSSDEAEKTRQFNAQQAAAARAASSPAAQALSNRLAGVNPGANTVQAASLPAASASNPPLPSTPSVGLGSGLMSSIVPTASISMAADADAKQSSALKSRSEAMNMDIRNITQLTRDLMDIKKQKSEIYRNSQSGNLSHAQMLKELKTLEFLEDSIQAQINNLNANAEAARKTAQAAVDNAQVNKQNAQTREAELDETTRHNKRIEAIQHYVAQTGRMELNKQVQVMDSIIVKNYAESDLADSSKRLNDETAKKRVETMASQIAKNYAERDLAEMKGKLAEKDYQTYYYRLALESIKTFFESERDHAVAGSNESKSANTILKIVGILLMRKP